MSALEAAQPQPATEVDRRRYQRVRISLLGRCMFADMRECPCQIKDISPGGALFVSPFAGQVGEKVIAYVDNIGRLEGHIARVVENGFAMTISASARKRDKLADTLTWLANRHVLNLTEDRRHARRTPKRAETLITFADGTSHPVRIIDMSLSGAAIATGLRPPLGTKLNLGRLGGRVVRHFDDGIAIEFMRIMSDTAIEKAIEKEFF